MTPLDVDREIEKRAVALLGPRLNCIIRKRKDSSIHWNLKRKGMLWSIGVFSARHIRFKDKEVKAKGVYLAKSKYDYGLKLSRERGYAFHFYIWTLCGMYGVWLPCEHEVQEDTGAADSLFGKGGDGVMIETGQFKKFLDDPLPENVTATAKTLPIDKPDVAPNREKAAEACRQIRLSLLGKGKRPSVESGEDPPESSSSHPTQSQPSADSLFE